VTISTKELKKALREVLAEENTAGILPKIIPPLQESIRIGNEVTDEPLIPTSEAIGYFFKKKPGLKDSTNETNRKRLNHFAAVFPELPLDEDTICEHYWSHYDANAPRYRRNLYDTLDDFYSTIMEHFHLATNPMDAIKRPDASGTGNIQPHPLNETWLPALLDAVETDMEMAALHTELAAGWRPCAYRRIKAIDVREALYRENPVILCRDKERTELTPLLSESLEHLAQMTPTSYSDQDHVIRSKRTRAGIRQPMGVKAHTTMVRGLYTRAGIPDSFVPYDLRDTFATMVLKYSRDWFLTERLLHHKLPGEGKRYAGYPIGQLCEDLQQFSPLRWIKLEPTVLARMGGQNLSVNGEGGTRTPTPFDT